MADANGVLLALGANLGDPAVQLRRAVDALGEWVDVHSVSSLYRSEPVGHRDQPDFINLVCAGATSLSPHELLRALQGVEDGLGRVRSFRDAPRTIDIDLLAYGDRVLESPDLVVPHPRMTERAFVLVPLAEVAPGWRHPRLGRTARELLARAGTLERIERLGPLPPGPRPPARPGPRPQDD